MGRVGGLDAGGEGPSSRAARGSRQGFAPGARGRFARAPPGTPQSSTRWLPGRLGTCVGAIGQGMRVGSGEAHRRPPNVGVARLTGSAAATRWPSGRGRGGCCATASSAAVGLLRAGSGGCGATALSATVGSLRAGSGGCGATALSATLGLLRAGSGGGDGVVGRGGGAGGSGGAAGKTGARVVCSCTARPGGRHWKYMGTSCFVVLVMSSAGLASRFWNHPATGSPMGSSPPPASATYL
jgi:hypothetical protein